MINRTPNEAVLNYRQVKVFLRALLIAGYRVIMPEAARSNRRRHAPIFLCVLRARSRVYVMDEAMPQRRFQCTLLLRSRS